MCKLCGREQIGLGICGNCGQGLLLLSLVCLFSFFLQKYI